jgi:hypothetical protein
MEKEFLSAFSSKELQDLCIKIHGQLDTDETFFNNGQIKIDTKDESIFINRSGNVYITKNDIKQFLRNSDSVTGYSVKKIYMTGIKRVSYYYDNKAKYKIIMNINQYPSNTKHNIIKWIITSYDLPEDLGIIYVYKSILKLFH